MKRVIYSSEVLGTVEATAGTCELCAAADANFDEVAGRLVVQLEAYLRPLDRLAKEQRLRADWLPENKTVTEAVSLEESWEMAGEIFHHWVRKVREAAPALHHR